MGTNSGNEFEPREPGFPDVEGVERGSTRSRLEQRVDDATSKVGRGVESMGERTRDRVAHAADRFADRTGTVGNYLQQHDLSAMADDAANVVRRYPVQSMLVGLGFGFMIGRMTSR